jgi:hypothetical protein
VELAQNLSFHIKNYVLRFTENGLRYTYFGQYIQNTSGHPEKYAALPTARKPFYVCTSYPSPMTAKISKIFRYVSDFNQSVQVN